MSTERNHGESGHGDVAWRCNVGVMVSSFLPSLGHTGVLNGFDGSCVVPMSKTVLFLDRRSAS